MSAFTSSNVGQISTVPEDIETSQYLLVDKICSQLRYIMSNEKAADEFVKHLTVDESGGMVGVMQAMIMYATRRPYRAGHSRLGEHLEAFMLRRASRGGRGQSPRPTLSSRLAREL